MEGLDILGLIVEGYGSAGAVALFLTVKGVASIVANNFNTEKLGKTGEVIDWFASNTKKAKLTGDTKVDNILKITAKARESKSLLAKAIKIFS